MLANCTRRILVLDDIIGSNANAVSINDFENNLKKYFENIETLKILEKREMEKCHSTAN